MKASLKKYLIIFCPIICFLLLMRVAVSYKHDTRHAPGPLEIKLAQVRLGATVEEADALFGTPPDETSQTEGVIMNPTTMLTASNEQAAQYGMPQEYVLRTWKGEEISATVAFDNEGQAVCRWVWSSNNPPPLNPYGPYRVFKRVGLF
ncbi:hypothetical protein [Gimesia panareensis]|uniref:hypothetical protein n=1 Tax=Gimesia panareensis TaxID=2527978 RepID=UPI00118D4C5F|nr:hypothetical protein [Gimesia panareensis]QDU49964.1 hypothetical protein Pan110_23050 [Gimesia panareensis]